jgi:hypothetical protein
MIPNRMTLTIDTYAWNAWSDLDQYPRNVPYNIMN